MRLFISFLTLLFLVINASALESPKLSTLEIVITNLDNSKGKIRIHLFNIEKSKYFPDKSDNAYKWQEIEIKNGTAKAVFKNIPYGKYAATLHHDVNLNKKMDLTWLGMPDEGWGLSTDVIPVFSLPDFEECSFNVNKPHVVYKIKMRYLP